MYYCIHLKYNGTDCLPGTLYCGLPATLLSIGHYCLYCPASTVRQSISCEIVVYRSLNGTAPRYLAADLRRLSDMPSRRRLRSSLTDQLDVRQSQCSAVGDRAFAVAGARLWNSLPHDIVASDTLSHFRRGLKTFLFRQSYPSILF